MMNLLGICVVVTSLATAGVWSPNPEKENTRHDDEVIVVKEGHRTVVVEFEKKEGDGNTKVLISPHHHDDHKKLSEKNGDGHGHGIGIGGHSSARELVCDALGKCKHKIANAKDKVSEAEEEAKEGVGEALGKAKETVSRKAHEISDKALEVEEKAKDKVLDKVHEVEKAKGKVMEKAHELVGKEAVAAAAAQKAKDGANDIQTNVSAVKGRVEKAAADTSDEGGQQKEKKINLRDILPSGICDVLINYWDGAMMMIHLLGFATAYGMCVWVTFVSSYVLAEALPRQQFGIVHSKIYPVYFSAMALCVGTVLFSHLFNTRKQLFFNTSHLLQAYNLLASLVMIFANLFYLEPQATTVMFERMKLEKEDGRGRDIDDSVTRPESMVADHVGDPASAPKTSGRPEEERIKTRMVQLTQRLKKLNNLSSFLNVLTLMGLSWHLVYLAQRLHSTS